MQPRFTYNVHNIKHRCTVNADSHVNTPANCKTYALKKYSIGKKMNAPMCIWMVEIVNIKCVHMVLCLYIRSNIPSKRSAKSVKIFDTEYRPNRKIWPFY